MLAGDWTQSDAYHRPRDSRADGTGRRGSWPGPLASVPLASVPLAPRRRSSGRILSGVLPAWTHRIIIARMARTTWIAGVITLFVSTASAAVGSDVDSAVESFLQAYCLACHDPDTSTRLNLTELERELETSAVSQRWEQIHDRIRRGEMPPPEAQQPTAEHRRRIVARLQQRLTQASRTRQRAIGRVPSRRLTRSEYQNTLHDLLHIGGDLKRYLPPENRASAFDVVASTQEMSRVHVQGLLTAADVALDEAIALGPRPQTAPREINYQNSPYMQMWVDRPVRRGGGTVFRTDKDLITFRGENYVLRSDRNGVRFPLAGQYRITVLAAAWQPRSSVTVSLKRQNDAQGESELFAAWDLVGEQLREVSTVKYLRPDDYIYVSADELEPAPDGKVIYNVQPASTYQGEGVRIRKVTVTGPLEGSWPPQRTTRLFPGITWERVSGRPAPQRAWRPVLTRPPGEHLRDVVQQFAERAWHRRVEEQELQTLVSLAEPSLAAGRDFVDCVRIPLRAILVSPELLFQTGSGGPLTDSQLARRLAAFLWRSAPDDRLMHLARQGRLSERAVLLAEVDRLLADSRRDRFVNDFLDQWLNLAQIDATTPDAYLYPEYDDVLRRAMLAETRQFFAHLLDENLSVACLVDSDFTFLNRRLAEHYGIAGVTGEAMRKVRLPPDSVRGGLLGQASLAKVTANGTVTSPVRRGHFVLSKILGQPASPPPPDVGSIEPDTRGATTIRETLRKHQAVDTCAACHRHIDPPGFALECFDPVGSFRSHYRISRGVRRTAAVGLRFLRPDYDQGPPVDASGVLEDGRTFDGIRQYREQLLTQTDQVARNMVSLLVTYATGAPIQFADRQEIDDILARNKAAGYPLRQLLSDVVTSRIFRNR